VRSDADGQEETKVVRALVERAARRREPRLEAIDRFPTVERGRVREQRVQLVERALQQGGKDTELVPEMVVDRAGRQAGLRAQVRDRHAVVVVRLRSEGLSSGQYSVARQQRHDAETRKKIPTVDPVTNNSAAKAMAKPKRTKYSLRRADAIPTCGEAVVMTVPSSATH
jgi:hypothetical protein